MTLVHLKWGSSPLFFPISRGKHIERTQYLYRESGDFGKYSIHSPYYIITMVFHNQEQSIESAIQKLNTELNYIHLDGLCLHTGPIIRKEEAYASMPLDERRRIFNKMIAFIRQINIHYKSFHIEKKHIANTLDATIILSKQISQFIKDNYEEFLSFDVIKLYYDNGQVEVSRILSSAFSSLLPNTIFKKVMPAQYKLFQVADLLCTMKLIQLKYDNSNFSKSELLFFGNRNDLNKNYLKPLRKKEWH